MSRPLLRSLDAILSRVHEAPRVFLALDFDGTLAPICLRPEDAVLPNSTALLLRRLVGRPILAPFTTTLALLSGRSIADLKQRCGVDCIYGGNHGLEIEGPGISFVHPEAVVRRPVLHAACAEVDAAIGGIEGAFVERKGLSATVHYRRVAAASRPRVRLAVERAMRPYAGCLDVLPARMAWEIRPHVPWCKGAALQFLLGHTTGVPPLVICAGDDFADETMFDAIPGTISIRVGNASGTAAQYLADDPATLAEFLARLPG